MKNMLTKIHGGRKGQICGYAGTLHPNIPKSQGGRGTLEQ